MGRADDGERRRSGTWGEAVAGRRRGQSMVELALMMPLLALILLGTVDLGRVFFAYTRLTHAVKEGALFGIRNPTNLTVSTGTADSTTCQGAPENITCRVILESGAALGLTGGNVTVKCYQSTDGTTETPCTQAGLTRGDWVVVTADHTFRPLAAQMAGLFPGGVTLKKSVRMVIL